MTERPLVVSLIGLDWMGASFGLALGAAPRAVPLQRLGYDPDPERAREAQKIGAVDQALADLQRVAEQADLLLLNLPLDAISALLPRLAPHLQPGAVILETAPAKAQVHAWMHAHLPPHIHHVGLLPALNPAYLFSAPPQAPRADLFRRAVLGLVLPAHAPEGVVRLAADFAHLLGALPLFLGQDEADGIWTAVELLPQVMAAALLHATTEAPGWREGRKFAGRAFAAATEPIATGPSPEAWAPGLQAHGSTLRLWLPRVIEQLQAVEEWISAQDEESLAQWWRQARQRREGWVEEQQASAWEENLPPAARGKKGARRPFGLFRRPGSPSPEQGQR